LLHEVKFIYDAFDRRIGQSVDSDGEGVATAVVTRFVYDGDHVWADYSSSGVVLARYLYGDRTDELLARYQPINGTAWYLTDNLGTVRDLVDESGDLLNHIDYDSFGRIIAQSNAAAGDRFTYTGREFDPEINLYYYRARYYDPVLGRFIANDPSGFSAGDANLFRYVENSPLTWVDPTGRFGVSYAMLSRAGTVAASGVAGYVLGWVCGYLEAAYSDDPAVQANKLEIAERAANFGFILGAATGLVAPVFPAITAATGLVGAAGYLFASGNNTQRGIRVGCIAASFLTGGVIGRLGPKVPRAPIDQHFGGFIGRFMTGENGSIGPQRPTSIMSKAGQQFDRNGLTVAGRALQKHGDRAGSVFPKSSGSAAARNAQGQEVLDGILNSTSRQVNRNRYGGQDIRDNFTNRGARFDGAGNFIGFLEP
jgi:RHS repeat-associated protein